MINQRIAFIGIGLIGGSLARGLRKSGYAGEIAAFSRSSETLDCALELGVIDRGAESIAGAIENAQIVVLATPVQSLPQILPSLSADIAADAVITDVGSVKRYVVDMVARHIPDLAPRFVPAHPIAGTENSGVAAAVDDLYQGKSVIVTPTSETSPDAIGIVEEMWCTVGAKVRSMDVDEHDQFLAIVSHLPHVAAYAMVDYVARSKYSDVLFELAAGGFYDFTRIASSDPIMWRDICITNRSAIVAALREYGDVIDAMVEAIESANGDALQSRFARAKQARDMGLDRKYRDG